MRLLHAVEGSVLWLLRDNATAEQNLRKEAAARGVGPGRLVFAPRMKLEDHLARHRLGESFAGRVAASLLNAIGLPELVTHSIKDYEALALRLAKDPSLLEGYRNRLATNRLTQDRKS